MNQQKTGQFLKQLRKEKSLTQEVLAERLNMSARTVSRWETGASMPDISLLPVLAQFYQVSISEIIDGERKNEEMNAETKTTAVKMAQYSRAETKAEKQKAAGALLIIFRVLTVISAMAVFPSDSSWGSIYSVIGGIVLTLGVTLRVRNTVRKRLYRFLCIACCPAALFGVFAGSDYLAVSQFCQVPRFCLSKTCGEDQIECRTLFFTAVRKNPGTDRETVEIVE